MEIILKCGRVVDGYYSELDTELSTEATRVYKPERKMVTPLHILRLAYPGRWRRMSRNKCDYYIGTRHTSYRVNTSTLEVVSGFTYVQFDSYQELITALEDSYEIDQSNS